MLIKSNILLSRMIFLVAAISAVIVTTVVIVQIKVTATGTASATRRSRRNVRRNWGQSRRGRSAVMRRQRRYRRIAQKAVRFVHVLTTHHIRLPTILHPAHVHLFALQIVSSTC